MAETLQFTKSGEAEICELSLSATSIIEVNRTKSGFFTIYGSLEGMEPTVIYTSPYNRNLIFKLDIPEFVTLRMVSESHVTNAKIQALG